MVTLKTKKGENTGPNVGLEKAIRDYATRLKEALGDEASDKFYRLLHDEWHEGHATGWRNSKSHYERMIEKDQVLLATLGHVHVWTFAYETSMRDNKEYRKYRCVCSAEREVLVK